MADDQVMIIMTSGPDTPRRCATPFFFASLAAAMEYEVTMFFTIDGTLLLKKGLAETIYPKAGGKPVSEFIQDALDAGVSFLACSASTELHDLQPEDLIDGVKMVGGASMWQIAEDCKTVLTF
ncbi:MAG: DsrE/DsrF/DrsH-like family protein [Anaerolineaceae bacterium]|jgi:predicted peroxiredoxin|nr:DsrE/DsrF/DrsH-like family protein [Anaerolineaceae bacterium]